MSRRSAGKDTSYLRVWGTHLRWASLCHEAWGIVFSGRAPLSSLTPPIVADYGKTVHEKILAIVREWFSKSPHALYMPSSDSLLIEYSAQPIWSDEPATLVLKPDVYVLWSTPRGPVNLAVEVTTRLSTYIPEEWLSAYALGLYIENLRPSFTILVTPERVSILPLSTGNVNKLKNLIDNGNKRKPTPSLCYNCDLRHICPNPLV